MKFCRLAEATEVKVHCVQIQRSAVSLLAGQYVNIVKFNNEFTQSEFLQPFQTFSDLFSACGAV